MFKFMSKMFFPPILPMWTRQHFYFHGHVLWRYLKIKIEQLIKQIKVKINKNYFNILSLSSKCMLNTD